MEVLGSLGTLAGGLGLFLLGMTMMSTGLKLAAGRALERILAAATRTRGHALASGMLVTALVQSSSAVTVATIGFVNAGLMGLGGALWVLFGANVGTTMTGWVVALVGLKFKVEALALPLVGLGVVLQLTGQAQRRGAFGGALAGFGLLFMGIALLQQAFTGLATQFTLPQGTGLGALAAQVLAGVVLTALMQSSSASMTVALTAAQGGLLTLQGAAAMVIGANIGTTVTALLAVIGATANARRVAVAHVAFNGLTALVALALLPWLLGAIGALRVALQLPADPAAQLALFHTVFNLMGVLLMWPLAAPLTRWLQTLFRARDEDEGQPRHLDDNVLQVPALALDALARELGRLGAVARRMLGAALAGAGAPALAGDAAVAQRLQDAIDAFVDRMNRAAMSAPSSALLTRLLRVLRYHEAALEQALQAASGLPERPHRQVAPEAAARFEAEATRLLDALARGADPAVLPDAAAEQTAQAEQAERAYQALKQAWLEAGAAGRVGVAEMDAGLRHISALRRGLQQAGKAVRPGASPPEAAAG
jgi:phosphate:Na+ symporter